MKKISDTEFSSFVLRGIKGVQGLEKLKEYRAMRFQIDMISQTHLENSIGLNEDARLFIEAIKKVEDEEVVKELSEIIMKLNMQRTQASLVEDAEEKEKLLDEIERWEGKIKKFLSDTLNKHPDILRDFLSKEVKYSLEKTDEVDKATEVLEAGLRLCLQSLGKEPKIVETWSLSDIQEFITEISKESENLVRYDEVFFLTRELPEISKTVTESSGSQPLTP